MSWYCFVHRTVGLNFIDNFFPLWCFKIFVWTFLRIHPKSTLTIPQAGPRKQPNFFGRCWKARQWSFRAVACPEKLGGTKSLKYGWLWPSWTGFELSQAFSNSQSPRWRAHTNAWWISARNSPMLGTIGSLTAPNRSLLCVHELKTLLHSRLSWWRMGKLWAAPRFNQSA